MHQPTHEDLWSGCISFKSLQVEEEDQVLCLCINQWLVEDSPGEEGDVPLDELILQSVQFLKEVDD